MTCAYRLKKELRGKERSVIHVDGTVRAQMVGEENGPYMELRSGVKKNSGYGIVLNTSFNIHGMPIVMTPRGRDRDDEGDKDQIHVHERVLRNKQGRFPDGPVSCP